jgi:hypothetical protein
VAELLAMVEQSRGTGVEVVYENHDQAGVMDYSGFSAHQEAFMDRVGTSPYSQSEMPCITGMQVPGPL